jgi:hypothetical protein
LSSLFSERSRAEESLRKIANRWQQYEIKAKIIFFWFHAVFCLQNHVWHWKCFKKVLYNIAKWVETYLISFWYWFYY